MSTSAVVNSGGSSGDGASGLPPRPAAQVASGSEANIIRDFLGQVYNRLTLIAAVQGAAAGLLLASLYVFVATHKHDSVLKTIGAVVVLGFVGIIVSIFVSRAKRQRPAMLVEQKSAECNNLLVTASELLSTPTVVAPIASLVYRQAAHAVRKLNAFELFPARNAFLMLAGSALLMIGSVRMRAEASDNSGIALGSVPALALAVNGIDAIVTAPAYTGRGAQSLRNPARVEALAGSTVKLTVAANADSLLIETLDNKHMVAPSSSGTFTTNVILLADGFVSLQPMSAKGARGTRRLIGLIVAPDHAPRVRLLAPGKDMMLPDGNRALDLTVDADDDLAIATLRLRYTTVSGSGERYTFKEGELPLQIARKGDTLWKASAHWNLAPLELESGDMVVYRAVVTDRRPGAPPVESDSYIAEVMAVGSEAAAGFAIEPDQERYALSQQMIIVKTERLLAKRKSISAEAFADGANEIAMEQRRVRAEFVFMMGGELADAPLPEEDMTTLHEEAEAEGEADIMDGRGENQGRVALVKAIRSMSSAATRLNANNVDQALVAERVALKQLERAFSHTRIILRALSQAERLDLTRRMTGPLLEAGRDVRSSPTPESNVRVSALRGTLAGVAELIGSAEMPADASLRVSLLAERAIRVNPSERALHDVAARLNEAAAALGKAEGADARRLLEQVAVDLTALLRTEVVRAPERARGFDATRLNGALADILRARPPK